MAKKNPYRYGIALIIVRVFFITFQFEEVLCRLRESRMFCLTLLYMD